MAGRVVVLGGAGAMARAVLRDLMEYAPEVELLVVDRTLEAARRRVDELGHPRARPAGVDVRDHAELTRLLHGYDVVINCVNAGLLEGCQRAALEAGVHYIDLGSWPAETARQMAMHDQFAARRLVAILGMGSAPGITNTMARLAVERLDQVESLHVKLAKVDRSPSRLPLNPPYALATILDELTAPAMAVEGGRLVEVPAQSGAEPLHCPDPMGTVEVCHVIHPEPFTFYHSFRERGLREASFKIGLPRRLLNRLRFLLELGLGLDREVEVDGHAVNLRHLLLKLAEPFASEVAEPGVVPEDYGYTVVVATGMWRGLPKEVRVELSGRALVRWGLSGGTARTGVPASIAAQFLLQGRIQVCGCLPPEQCIDPVPFFRELARRGMNVYVTERVAAFEADSPSRERE